MTQYKKWLIFLVIWLSSSSVFSQETYRSQHSQAERRSSQTLSKLDAGTFVGCIDYVVTYVAVATGNHEQRKRAEFAIAEVLKSSGDQQTQCFNADGDWVRIYKNASWDMTWSNIPQRRSLELLRAIG